MVSFLSVSWNALAQESIGVFHFQPGSRHKALRKDGKTHPAGPDGRTIRDGLDPLRAICRMAELLAGRLASPGIEQAPVPAKLVRRSPEPLEHVRPGEIENVLKRPTDRDVYIRRQDPLGLGLSCLRVGGDIRRAKQDRKSTRLNSSHVAISYAV